MEGIERSIIEMELKLDESHDDVLRLVLADAYEESGYVKYAEFQRLMSKHRRYPEQGWQRNKDALTNRVPDHWFWWIDPINNGFDSHYYCACLGKEGGALLDLSFGKGISYPVSTEGVMGFPSRRDAEMALYLVWRDGEWAFPKGDEDEC